MRPILNGVLTQSPILDQSFVVILVNSLRREKALFDFSLRLDLLIFAFLLCTPDVDALLPLQLPQVELVLVLN